MCLEQYNLVASTLSNTRYVETSSISPYTLKANNINNIIYQYSNSYPSVPDESTAAIFTTKMLWGIIKANLKRDLVQMLNDAGEDPDDYITKITRSSPELQHEMKDFYTKSFSG